MAYLKYSLCFLLLACLVIGKFPTHGFGYLQFPPGKFSPYIPIPSKTGPVFPGKSQPLPQVYDNTKSNQVFPGKYPSKTPAQPPLSRPGDPPANFKGALTLQCSTDADIIFVLDASKSIGDTDFKKLLSFISTMTATFKTGSDAARFGLVAFSDNVHKQFDLKDTTGDQTALSQAILKTPYYSGGTSTDIALDFVIRNKMFDSNSGGRPNAPDIVIVVTDGQSERPVATSSAAEKLRNAGAKVFAVGIGQSANQKELLDIASSKDNVFRSTDFDVLGFILDQLAKRTCVVATNDKPATTSPSVPSAWQPVNEKPSYGPPAYVWQPFTTNTAPVTTTAAPVTTTTQPTTTAAAPVTTTTQPVSNVKPPGETTGWINCSKRKAEQQGIKA